MNEDSYVNFLRNIVEFLKEELNELCSKANEDLSDQEIGRQMALYSVIKLISNEASVFGINFNEIGLKNYDPDRDAFRRK